MGLLFFITLIVLGAITGVHLRSPMNPLILKGITFVVFLLPYWIGRFSGGGSFGMEDVNFVFTAPILPRTVLLSGLIRRFSGMLLVTVCVACVFIFTSFLVGEIELTYILLAGLYGFILIFICKLFGMYLFVAYKKAFRWIGLFWMLILAVVFFYYTFRAEWDWRYGLFELLESPVFDFTPIVGWATAGVFSFINGQILFGLLFTFLLLALGLYFFVVIYRSKPDFYEETIGSADDILVMPTIDDDDIQEVISSNLDTKPPPPVPGAYDFTVRKIGAAAFLYKQIKEATKTSRMGILGTGIFGWIAYAIAWGLYVRFYNGNIEFLSTMFIFIGVPVGNILAVLAPMIAAISIYPQFDRGFREFGNPYFYLVPDRPGKKLLWASISRIIYVCVAAIVVLIPAGIISQTSPIIVIAVILAYLACSFMVLGVRTATTCFFNAETEAGRRLTSTLTVFVCVLIGWIGLMAIFFLGPVIWGLLFGLLAFAGWCVCLGIIGFWYGVRRLHGLENTSFQV